MDSSHFQVFSTKKNHNKILNKSKFYGTWPSNVNSVNHKSDFFTQNETDKSYDHRKCHHWSRQISPLAMEQDQDMYEFESPILMGINSGKLT